MRWKVRLTEWGLGLYYDNQLLMQSWDIHDLVEYQAILTHTPEAELPDPDGLAGMSWRQPPPILRRPEPTTCGLVWPAVIGVLGFGIIIAIDYLAR